MSTNNFLKKENIELLWEVLVDENIIKSQHVDTVKSVFQIFNNNLKSFYENEKNRVNNLIDMNKKYIMLILNYVNSNFSNVKSREKSLITSEEIQNDRISQFDRNLNKRKEEFMNSMSINVPPVPDFGMKLDDEPISEIEQAIKKMTDQRKYDLEEINKNFTSQSENWLKSTETSLKSEKLNPQSNKINQLNQLNNQNNLKYIKIENQELDNTVYKNQIIDLNNVGGEQSSKKHITWADDKVIENNIFNKLKKIGNPEKIEDTHKISLLQEDVKNINIKIETMNDNINKLLDVFQNLQDKNTALNI